MHACGVPMSEANVMHAIRCQPPAPCPFRLAVGDLARRFGLGAEMIGTVLSERVASGAIRGRMEAGVVYTQAYLARIKAQLRWGRRRAGGRASKRQACRRAAERTCRVDEGKPRGQLSHCAVRGTRLRRTQPRSLSSLQPLRFSFLCAGERCGAQHPRCRFLLWSKSWALRAWPR